MPLVIEKLYAWIMLDEDGDEAVPAMEIADTGWMPMIGSNQARVESLRPIVQQMVDARGVKAVLKVFGTGVTIDDINPVPR
jgi:hypothetical protein